MRLAVAVSICVILIAVFAALLLDMTSQSLESHEEGIERLMTISVARATEMVNVGAWSP